MALSRRFRDISCLDRNETFLQFFTTFHHLSIHFQPGLNPQSQVHFQTSLPEGALIGLLGFSGPSITFRQSHAPHGLTFVLFSKWLPLFIDYFLVKVMVKSNGLAFKILCERYLSAYINNSFIIIWENWDKIL